MVWKANVFLDIGTISVISSPAASSANNVSDSPFSLVWKVFVYDNKCRRPGAGGTPAGARAESARCVRWLLRPPPPDPLTIPMTIPTIACDIECQACTHVAGIPELVARLQARGADVFLVSGGFRAIIDPIADLLAIPRDHVFANTILFQVQRAHWLQALACLMPWLAQHK